MTITPSMSSHRLMVAFARLDIERYTTAPTRETVAVLLPLWCGYAGMTEDEIAEVLASYPPAEPEMVAGRDYLAQAEADAAVIVAEALADATVGDKQSSVRPGEHAEKMIAYRGEHHGWVGICACGHQTTYYSDRVSALLRLSSHIVKATEQVEVTAQPSEVA